MRLIPAGHFWDNTTPQLELGSAVKLTPIGNCDVPHAGVDADSLAAMAAALDDLRSLGEAERKLAEAANWVGRSPLRLAPDPGAVAPELLPLSGVVFRRKADADELCMR